MSRLAILLFGHQPRLGRRLIVHIVAFSSLITLCISLVQLFAEYRSLRDALDRQLDGVRIYVPSIAGSVWDFDEQQVQRALDALILLPNVAQTNITTPDTGKQWRAGRPSAGTTLTRTYPLTYAVRGSEREIGTLTVIASLDGIYHQVATSAVSIVLSNGVKTFLVAFFMVVLIRRLVTTRLERMAYKVRHLIPDTLPLDQGPSPLAPVPHELDELDAVDWTLDETAVHLAQALAKRKQAEEKIEFLAYHDALTGLPNRRLLEDRVQQAMALSERAQSKVALIFLDLDNFKTINDSLGHLVGDGLVNMVGQRLVECVRDTDTVSRQGGDEFLIMLPALPDADAIAPVLVKLLGRLGDPGTIDGHELTTSASIGIAIFPDDGSDFDTLLKKADMAMYRAKEAGRNTYRFFDDQMNSEAVEQLRLRSGLRRALAQNELVLHYQPQLDIASGALIGAEALIRWHHPELGMVPPGRFIPIAEDSGLIVPIGEWVLREACRQAVSWQRAGMRELVVAVNLSAIQFKRGDIEQSVIAALEESGLAPTRLELELTESIIIHDTEKTLDAVQRLKRLGVTLSIDDFGTGYSSLSYLKRFQVDKLKIDQSFVRDLASDDEDAAIVRAIIQMAHSLGLTTIAEGVEDAGALARLREFGCDQAQGYFYARPMPGEDFTAVLRKRPAPTLN